MPESAVPVKGTRPEGAVTESDASKKVREMFTQIAPRYDLLNHLLSLQLDRVWRARTAARLRPILDRRDAVVLDLCCGTGDLALALSRSANARIIGADFAHTMLVRAREKSAARVRSGSVTQASLGSSSTPAPSSNAAAPGPLSFLEADALRLPFADRSFDLVTTAFGFRNLANYEAGLREIQRVLKPGGTIAILEFTEPPDGLLGNLYRWYFRTVLPKIGGLISGDRAAYSYLPKSVARFFQPGELAALMTQSGYQSVEFRAWTFGTVALHIGNKL
ncbi:MAG TPA: class I SAM-dependent methyltransferase [Candidatus Dormibacteraeota bacterium]|nr:class I SAM-dependent methyltransferase [Candidatus Dormibacteraeota bacterium]